VKAVEFSIQIEFDDGVKVTLGGDDELFVEAGSGSETATLNDVRLELIKRLQDVQTEVTE
jgi:hypothetical protein